MNEFNKVRELIESLTEFESKYIKSYFKNASSNYNPISASELYDKFVKNKYWDDIQMMDSIYGENNKIAFKKSLQRFYGKLLDVLISKEVLTEAPLYTERTKELFIIKKKFLYYDSLTSHGLSNQSFATLNQIIDLSKKIEAFDYLLMALNYQMKRISRRVGITKLEQIVDEIAFYNHVQVSLLRAEYIVAFYSSNLLKTKLDLSKHFKLEEEIFELEQVYTNSKSQRLKSFIFILNGIHMMNENKIRLLKANFYKFYDFQKHGNSKIVKKSEKLSCLLNIIELELKDFQFNRAIKLWEEVDQLNFKTNFNKNIIFEMKFLNYWHLGDIATCKKNLNGIVKEDSSFESTMNLVERCGYYLAAIEFVQGGFIESKKHLSELNRVAKIDSVWNINIRLFLFYLSIEANKFSLCSSYLESFRKYLAKSSDKMNIEEIKLYKSILKIWIVLDKYGYDFKRTFAVVELSLIKIDIDRLSSRLDYRSPFLIPFTPWFIAKVKNVPYDHTKAMKEIQHKIKREKLELA